MEIHANYLDEEPRYNKLQLIERGKGGVIYLL
jgi:hypothetical protein